MGPREYKIVVTYGTSDLVAPWLSVTARWIPESVTALLWNQHGNNKCISPIARGCQNVIVSVAGLLMDIISY